MTIQPFVNPLPSPFPLPIVTNAVQQVSLAGPQELSLNRYVNYIADLSGCAHWRILWPESLINMTGRGISSSLTAMVFDPRWYQGVKAVKIQRQATTHQKEFVKFLKKIQPQCGFKLIYEVDDVVFHEEIPNYNKFKHAFASEEIRTNCVDIINMCDEVVVTCDFMRKLYQEKTGKKEITVVPNFIPHSWMGHQFSKRKIWDAYDSNKRRPRILYTGSGAHYDVDNNNGGIDDFSHVIEFTERTLDKYQWVFVGAVPPTLMKYVKTKQIEFHPWQNLASYPSFIASLNAQVMIAPLVDNNFNKSKSDIKFIEACILGLPCMVQDMETYKDAPEFLKFKTGDDLEEKLVALLKNKPSYYRNVNLYRHIGEQRFLELNENIGCHMELLDTEYGSSQRKYLKRWNP